MLISALVLTVLMMCFVLMVFKKCFYFAHFQFVSCPGGPDEDRKMEINFCNNTKEKALSRAQKTI